jgi:hypothetical protein
MNDHPAPYVFDVRAIHAWSKASGNVSKNVLGDVSQGSVAVYGRVWKDFCDAYPDEANVLKVNTFTRPRVTKEHRLQAAALTAKADDTFAPKGPYDDCSELIVAGIASCEGGTVVTDARRKPRYEAIDGLSVVTFEEYLDLL